MPPLVLLQHSESQRIEILKIYGRTPESIKQDIDNIKKWHEKQPHLPEIPSDKAIERLLVVNKFHIEDVKAKIDMYYSIRSITPEFFGNLPDSPAIQQIMEVIYIVPLPKLTEGLQRVIIFRLQDADCDKYDPITVMAHMVHIAEVRLCEECASSDMYIYDLTGFKVGHLLKYTPLVIKKISFVLEKLFANRTIGIHFLNAPEFIDLVLSFVTKYVKPKLAVRVSVHKDLNSLQKAVAKDLLPEDYGGEAESLKVLHDQWRRKLLEHCKFFEHMQSLRVNEELRPEKLSADDLLGTHGNFRQLNVD